MVLWLRYVRPANVPVTIKEIEAPVEPEKSIIVEVLEEPQLEENETDPVIVNPTESKVEVGQDNVMEINGTQVPESEQKLFHEVKPKETLYAISNLYGVSVMNIVEWNDLNIADGISIGQILEVRVPENWEERLNESQEVAFDEFSETNQYQIYRVQPGDTMYAIATKFKVSIEEIMEWNDKENPSISIGEEIKIMQ